MINVYWIQKIIVTLPRKTPAPAGYEPFYVTHYGRHGARYMTDDDAYKYVIGKMDTAQIRGWLSDKGKEVLKRVKLAADNAWHRCRRDWLATVQGRRL